MIRRRAALKKKKINISAIFKRKENQTLWDEWMKEVKSLLVESSDVETRQNYFESTKVTETSQNLEYRRGDKACKNILLLLHFYCMWSRNGLFLVWEITVNYEVLPGVKHLGSYEQEFTNNHNLAQPHINKREKKQDALSVLWNNLRSIFLFCKSLIKYWILLQN